MEHIFYVLTFFAILYEHTKLTDPDKVKRKIARITEDNKNGKQLDKDAPFILLILGYALWTFLGLLSSQWIIFLVLFLMGGIVVLFGKKPPNIVIQIDSLITILLFFFMLINKYHLHINLYQELFK